MTWILQILREHIWKEEVDSDCFWQRSAFLLVTGLVWLYYVTALPWPAARAKRSWDDGVFRAGRDQPSIPETCAGLGDELKTGRTDGWCCTFPDPSSTGDSTKATGGLFKMNCAPLMLNHKYIINEVLLTWSVCLIRYWQDFSGADAPSSPRLGSTSVFLCKCSCTFSGETFNELQQTDVLNSPKKNQKVMKHVFVLTSVTLKEEEGREKCTKQHFFEKAIRHKLF